MGKYMLYELYLVIRTQGHTAAQLPNVLQTLVVAWGSQSFS